MVSVKRWGAGGRVTRRGTRLSASYRDGIVRDVGFYTERWLEQGGIIEMLKLVRVFGDGWVMKMFCRTGCCIADRERRLEKGMLRLVGVQ